MTPAQKRALLDSIEASLGSAEISRGLLMDDDDVLHDVEMLSALASIRNGIRDGRIGLGMARTRMAAA